MGSPVTDICSIMEKYIDDDGGIFRFKGENFEYVSFDLVSKLYEQTGNYRESDFQKDLIKFFLTGSKPVYNRIDITLHLIADIRAVIVKYVSCGFYSEESGEILIEILTENFRSAVSEIREVGAEFYKYPKFIEFFEYLQKRDIKKENNLKNQQTEPRLLLPETNENGSECHNDIKNIKANKWIALVCITCILFGIIGLFQKIQWMIIVFFIFIGSVVWGLYSEVISPKVVKALTPDPNWDAKTTERFNKLAGWIIILIIIVVTFILNKLGVLGEVDPEESHLFRAPW